MDEVERLSGLIGDIYDAALDPALWPKVLEATCGYVRGVSSALVSHDTLQKNAQFLISWGDNPEYTKSYHAEYVKINPSTLPATIYGKVGEVSSYLDFTPLNEYRASRFFKEWAGPQG